MIGGRAHRLPIAPSLVALVLIAAAGMHAGVWYLISRRLGLSGAVVSALIGLVVLKHLGWFGGAYALLKRGRSTTSGPRPHRRRGP